MSGGNDDTPFAGLSKYGKKVEKSQSSHFTSSTKSHWDVKGNNKCHARFLREYCDYECIDGREDLGVAELNEDVMPVMISMKLEIKGMIENVALNSLFIAKLVSIYQQVLCDVLCMPSDYATSYVCCVLMSEPYYLIDVTHIYLRLHFPYCHVNVETQLTSLYSKALKVVDIGYLSSLLKFDGAESFTLYNNTKQFIRSPIPLYGSFIAPSYSPVKLIHIFTLIQDINSIEEDIEFYELSLDDVFVIQQHPLFTDCDLPKNQYIPLFFSIHYSNQSIIKEKVTTPISLPALSLEEEIVLHESAPSSTQSSVDCRKKQKPSSLNRRAQALLTMLGQVRVEERHFWLDVGRSLFFVTNGEKVGMEEWLQWTIGILAKKKGCEPSMILYFEDNDQKTSSADAEPLDKFGKGIPSFLRPDSYSKFKGTYEESLNKEKEETDIDIYNVDPNSTIADQCQQLWEKFTIYPKSLTLNTIEWYAKLDSPDVYTTWHNKLIKISITKALTLSHKSVADLVKEIWGLEFLSVGPKEWYRFSGHGWVECQHGVYLTQIFGNELVDVIRGYLNDLNLESITEMTKKKSKKANDDWDPSNFDIDDHKSEEGEREIKADQNASDQRKFAIDRCLKLIAKLEDVGFQCKLLTACFSSMYNQYFLKFRDNNPNLIGVLNGVIETCNGYATFRAGKPEDYISMRTESLYDETLHWNHPHVLMLLKWFRQIFGDRELLWFCLMLFASWLRGKNYSKLWVVMIGMGNNSKSMLKRLFDSVFGMYSFGIPSSHFTQQKETNSSACTPELIPCKTGHIGWFTEVSKLPIIADRIKRQTGLDEIPVRGLYEGQKNIVPFHHLVTQSNSIPYVQGMDEAMEIRFLPIPFTALWSVNAPSDLKEQEKLRHYKLDRNFDNRIPIMVSACLWVLVQFYSDFCKYGLAWRPVLVQRKAQDYFYKMDPFYRFQRECIKIVPSKTKGDGKTGVDLEHKVTVAQLYARFRDWVEQQGEKNKIMVDRNEFEDCMSKRLRMVPERNAWYGIQIGSGFEQEELSEQQELYAKEELETSKRYKTSV